MVKTYAASRTSSVRRVLWIVFFLNLAVALAKYGYGVFTSSESMQADGIHSIFDSAGNVVGLLGITLALRPADDSHPYGHFKFETYASMIIGLFLVLAALEVGSSAITALVTQNFVAVVTPISYAVMIFTLAVNIGVTLYERRKSKELNSEVLHADASHTLSDALVSVGVIVGLFLVQCGFAMADAIVALIVMVAILFTAFDVFKSALETLSDASRIPEHDIRDIVEGISGVKNAHRVRTRGTQGDVYVDLHILVDPSMSVSQAHALTDQIEDTITYVYPQAKDVLVHVEPYDEEHDLTAK